MFTYILPAIGLVILVISVILAIKSRHSTQKCISFVTVGVFLAAFFMILPTQWIDGKRDFPFAYTLLSSIAYSFDTLSGGQDYVQIETIGLTGILRTVYIAINYICFIAMPLLASSLVLSLFGDMGERMKYFFSFSKKCHVFSELNHNSLQLAKGIRKAKKGTVVFCDTKDVSETLRESASKNGCILLHKSCENVRVSRRFKRYEFYLISDSEDINIQAAGVLILKHRDTEKRSVAINAFAHSGNNIKILEHLLVKKPCDIFVDLTKESLEYAKNSSSATVFCNAAKVDAALADEAGKYGFTLLDRDVAAFMPYPEFARHRFTVKSISEDGTVVSREMKVLNNRLTDEFVEDALQLRFIDETSLFCNDLLYRFPLYSSVKQGSDLISVMIVGCGKLGVTMLKTVLWCGQIPGYRLKIRVYDKDAARAESMLYKTCPELALEEYDIKFISADIDCEDFEKKLCEGMDATYAVVATGDDELNIDTAEYLYSQFRKNHGFEKTPPIFARVRSDIKSINLSQESTFLSRRNIRIFGTTECVYSEKTLFNTELENLALATHLCYFDALKADTTDFRYKEAVASFYASEYDRRSSMATALHIASKLRVCGITGEEGGSLGEKEAGEFEALIKDGLLLEKLSKNEHDRWNAFMRSEGYRKASMVQMEAYAKKTGSHKDDDTKLHPCIVPWDELDSVAEKFNSLGVTGKKADFKKYDIKIVREIPEIIRAANRLNAEG